MIGQLCLFYLRLSGFSAYQRLFMPARAHLYQILQSNEQPLQKDSPPFFTREQLSDYVEKPPGRCLAQFMLEHCCRVQDKDISNMEAAMDWIRENWFFLTFFILFVAMYLFSRGMHGGHGGHRGYGEAGGEKDHAGHEKNGHTGSHGCC
jgi:hypothetical protein